MAHADSDQFLGMRSARDLAKYLGIPYKELTFFAYSDVDFYTSFLIPKRSGGSERRICAPKPKLKEIQRLIADTLSMIYEAPDAVHGFVSGRSTATNASQHVNKRAVIKIDLSDFFPSISAGRVRGLFKKKPFCFTDEVADALTNLVCYKKSLPQGAPSSPVLSNMICFTMDCTFMQYARRNRLKYTRYADDITFSSTTKRGILSVCLFDDNGSAVLRPEIIRIVENNGFRVNGAKTGVFSRGTRQVVTGIVVNRKCNFRRGDYRYLRNLFHCWEKSGSVQEAASRYSSFPKGRHYYTRLFRDDAGFDEGAFISHIRGLLCYYQMIAWESGYHSRPLQRLWARFYDLTKQPVLDMLPERLVYKTDSYAKYRRRGDVETKPYGVSGSCFLLGAGDEAPLLISAKHCAKSIKDQDLAADYDDDSSTFDVKADGKSLSVKYQDMIDGGVSDWLVIPAPNELCSLSGLSMDVEYMVQEGEKIIAYGFADGKGELRRIEATVVNILADEVVVDRAFIKGMSGGPVLNARGNVIGLITKGSADGSYDRDGRFMPISIIPFDYVKKRLLKS